jgi:hexosaminidase
VESRPPGIIPKPVLLQPRDGRFLLDQDVRVVVEPRSAELLAIACQGSESLARITGRAAAVDTADHHATSSRAIRLSTVAAGETPGAEGYELTVTPQSIAIRAAGPAGIFYGVQTLGQLLPPEGAMPGRAPGECSVPCVHIVDRPRFAWRGMHLDVVRHFYPKEFIKRFIDHLAAYKLNVFHLYLTDDEGWRIEIKRYPRLTEVGAWRSGTLNHTYNGPGDRKRYGGFYTQDDIREIVRYAQERSVTVVPGISMPGHCQAALACYPELASTPGPFEVRAGVLAHTVVMDPGKEEVFRFVEGVLSEVIGLFPSPYIHVGGDEVRRDCWKASPYAQARMKQEGLRSEAELQSYFTRRVERFLTSRGRKLVGWDEILEGGLAPRAVVMSWRGTAGGIAAARARHQVVMSPNTDTYLNFMQQPAIAGPGAPRYLPLLKVYHFDPLRGLTPDEGQYVLGGQGCMWTEYIPTPADVEYLLFPRLLAMAEVLWSPPADRDDGEFLNRAAAHLRRLKLLGVGPCDGDTNAVRNGDFEQPAQGVPPGWTQVPSLGGTVQVVSGPDLKPIAATHGKKISAEAEKVYLVR